MAKQENKSMSRFTAMENRNVLKSQPETLVSPNPGAKASITLADNMVKDIIRNTRVELRRAQNITKNILTWRPVKVSAQLKCGPTALNEWVLQPGVP